MATTCISRPSSVAYAGKSKKGAGVVLKSGHIGCYYSTATGKSKSSRLCLGNGNGGVDEPVEKEEAPVPVPCHGVARLSELEVDVPCSVAYQCYSDRELIPQWMPFISSVTVLKDKPDLSKWSLKYNVFNQDVEFSWLARNLQPIPNQKIHWRSLEGLPNRGAVRFFPKGPSSCRVELTVSYEVPQVLAPAASALKPLLEGLLLNGLKRFATVAKEYKKRSNCRNNTGDLCQFMTVILKFWC